MRGMATSHAPRENARKRDFDFSLARANKARQKGAR